MATLEVDEFFPGATVAGMAAVGGFTAIPGSSEGIRSIHVLDYRDSRDPTDPKLECLYRKGFARGARMGKLQSVLNDVPDGVRARGTFGPDVVRNGCVVQLVALFTFGTGVYLCVTRHSTFDFCITVLSIVLLVYARRLGRFVAVDDWNTDDLKQVVTVLHGMYDGAAGSPKARVGPVE